MATQQTTAIEENQQLSGNLDQVTILFLRLTLKQSPTDPVNDGIETAIPSLCRCLSRIELDTEMVLQWEDLILAQIISQAESLGEVKAEQWARRRLMQHLVRKYSEAA